MELVKIQVDAIQNHSKSNKLLLMGEFLSQKDGQNVTLSECNFGVKMIFPNIPINITNRLGAPLRPPNHGNGSSDANNCYTPPIMPDATDFIKETVTTVPDKLP